MLLNSDDVTGTASNTMNTTPPAMSAMNEKKPRAEARGVKPAQNAVGQPWLTQPRRCGIARADIVSRRQ